MDHQLLDPRLYSHGWYDANDIEGSMQRAIIIRTFAHMFAVLQENDGKEISHYREFIDSVLARKPFRTKHRSIIDMVAAASQMVSPSNYETREELIKLYLVNEMEAK